MAANVRRALALFDEDIADKMVEGQSCGSKQDSMKVIGTNKRHMKRRLRKFKLQEQEYIRQRQQEKKKRVNVLDEYRKRLPKCDIDRNIECLQLLSHVGRGVHKNIQQILEHHDPSWKKPAKVKEEETIFTAEDFANFEKQYFTS